MPSDRQPRSGFAQPSTLKRRYGDLDTLTDRDADGSEHDEGEEAAPSTSSVIPRRGRSSIMKRVRYDIGPSTEPAGSAHTGATGVGVDIAGPVAVGGFIKTLLKATKGTKKVPRSADAPSGSGSGSSVIRKAGRPPKKSRSTSRKPAPLRTLLSAPSDIPPLVPPSPQPSSGVAHARDPTRSSRAVPVLPFQARGRGVGILGSPIKLRILKSRLTSPVKATEEATPKVEEVIPATFVEENRPVSHNRATNAAERAMATSSDLTSPPPIPSNSNISVPSASRFGPPPSPSPPQSSSGPTLKVEPSELAIAQSASETFTTPRALKSELESGLRYGTRAQARAIAALLQTPPKYQATPMTINSKVKKANKVGRTGLSTAKAKSVAVAAVPKTSKETKKAVDIHRDEDEDEDEDDADPDDDLDSDIEPQVGSNGAQPSSVGPDASGALVRRTFPESTPLNEEYSLFYRRFPVPSHFEPGDPVGEYVLKGKCVYDHSVLVILLLFNGLNLCDRKQKCPLSGAQWNPQSKESEQWSPWNLYLPRFVKGRGADKLGLCPICVEPKSRGGEGCKRFLKMKVSAYSTSTSFPRCSFE